MNSLEDQNQLEKTSKIKRLAKIQVVIAVVAAAFTIIICLQIYPLLQMKTKLTMDIKKLNNEIKNLKDQEKELIEKNKSVDSRLSQAVNILNKKESSTLNENLHYDAATLLKQIKPMASSKFLYTLAGKNIFYFKLWIEANEDVKQKISRVDYYFNHPSFEDEKTMSSQNAKDKFSVGYTGWGCLSLVTITVFTKDGQKFDIYFDMCGQLLAEKQKITPK